MRDYIICSDDWEGDNWKRRGYVSEDVVSNEKKDESWYTQVCFITDELVFNFARALGMNTSFFKLLFELRHRIYAMML